MGLLKDPVAALIKHCGAKPSVFSVAIVDADTNILSVCLSAAGPQAGALLSRFSASVTDAKVSATAVALAVLHRRTEAVGLLASSAMSARVFIAEIATVRCRQPDSSGVNSSWSVLYNLAPQPEKLSARICEERNICSSCTLSECVAVLMRHLSLADVHRHPLIFNSASRQHPISVFGFVAAHANVTMLRVLLGAPWAAAALQELGRPVLAVLQCEHSPSACMMTRFCPPYGSCQPPKTVDQALRRLRRWQCLELLFRARCSAAGGEEMQAVLCGLGEAARLLEGQHARELAAVHRFLTQSVHACAHCGFYGRWAACAQCQLVCTPALLVCHLSACAVQPKASQELLFLPQCF